MPGLTEPNPQRLDPPPIQRGATITDRAGNTIDISTTANAVLIRTRGGQQFVAEVDILATVMAELDRAGVLLG